MTDITESTVRAEVRAWLQQHFDPTLGLAEWRERLVDSGWGVPHWPGQWYGRDLPLAFLRVVEEEFKRVDAITVARNGAATLAGITILTHGNDELRGRFLRRSLTGEDVWCQLFSEPGNGSDLAGAMTRAERRGDRWVVNGQKVWTTSAHLADYGLLLARTDLDVPKHDGLSYFLINMRQPGVEVVPLRQMNGHASFNQVFLTDAEVPAEYLLEQEGAGWRIATTTLMHERRNADATRRKVVPTRRPERIFKEEADEIAVAMAPYTWYPQRGGRVDLVLERARETGLIHDPVARQEIARLLILSRSAEWTAQRAQAAHELGRPQGPEGSIGKLATSQVARAANRVHTLLSGADAMLSGEDAPLDGVISEVLISTPAISIAGGTDEIQKNIISERVLRMPKEARFDTDRPYRDVPKNRMPD
ncbi:MAG: acyl-CoA dehydrogenase family protein [Gammaproteobacteria bacterium]|nr:acyl-CoA dehydrogenase family protein [Gammaproteobacteria bacterium]